MKPNTIDLTPTWESLALHIANLATNGTTFDSMQIGKEELLKMARCADAYVAQQTEHQPLNTGTDLTEASQLLTDAEKLLSGMIRALDLENYEEDTSALIDRIRTYLTPTPA